MAGDLDQSGRIVDDAGGVFQLVHAQDIGKSGHDLEILSFNQVAGDVHQLPVRHPRRRGHDGGNGLRRIVGGQEGGFFRVQPVEHVDLAFDVQAVTHGGGQSVIVGAGKQVHEAQQIIVGQGDGRGYGFLPVLHVAGDLDQGGRVVDFFGHVFQLFGTQAV